ncbi:MAG: arsenical pump-driving ATPase [Chloroflexi bacterium]|nr:arsenical pump-driving ATPase [Chloroflexota bacterium]
MKELLAKAPRFLFFTGKGGVGKTSLSSATAVALADQGKTTLLVSTDPASNLDQVLGIKLGGRPTPVHGTENLWALNIDPRRAAALYREKVVGPYRGVLPDAAVAEIEEQLSGACTVEIAAFDEFSRLMTDTTSLSEFEHVVFDTAPTGHTLRLLQLPAAWKGYLESSSGNASCLGPMSGLQGQREQFAATLAALTDADITQLVLVARPDPHALAEAERTSIDLESLGVHNQYLAINAVLEEAEQKDPVAEAMYLRQADALANIPNELQKFLSVRISLSPITPLGVPALRGLLESEYEFSPEQSDVATWDANDTLNLPELIDFLDMKSGVIMTMGKGGVGKTTIASRIAVELSRRGANVHLTTTDPAAHLDFALADKYRNLRVSRIDPVVETNRYRREVMAQAGSQLDEEGRRLLEEDLRSPCTEEIAVFRAFARVVDEARNSVVVIDTAPTGHTILLLDATEAYHREVSRTQSSVPDEVRFLLPRLRDPHFTRIMIVTLPEATPIQEADDLRKDLERAGIKPYAWVINQSLASLVVNHPVLKAKRLNEFQYLRQVQAISPRMVIVPMEISRS